MVHDACRICLHRCLLSSQDGGAAHEYGKGRGSLHMHALFWLANARDQLLELELAAELPDDAPLAAVISRVQRSTECSRAPTREACSVWEWCETAHRWILHLRHPWEFARARLRPYVVSLMRILRCSQDVQWWSGRTALLRYVSGYVSKYSEAFDEEWLRQPTAPLAAALAVVRNWRAAEPEMSMVLSREAMAFSSHGTVVWHPPRPREAAENSAVYLYRRRPISEEHAQVRAGSTCLSLCLM